MMSSVKYSRVPLSDPKEEEKVSAFDYSSPFSYEDAKSSRLKYKSVFTYNTTSIQLDGGLKENEGPRPSLDNVARLLVLVGFFVIYTVTFPIMVWFSFKKIQTHERFVIFRLGRLQKCKGPGVVFMFPLLDQWHKIDVRLKAFSVPPKQIITGDGAIIEVGAEIYFQIMDAKKSVTNVQDLNRSTRVLLQTSLCNILSKKTLSEIESERRTIAETLMITSNITCIGWGVEIQRAELSQIKVLSEAPAKSAPTLMMPPGFMGAGAGAGTGQGLPSALMHLASAVMSNQGPEQTGAIAEAFKAFTGAVMPPVENPPADDNSDQVDSRTSINIDTENTAPRCYSKDEIIVAIRNALSQDLVCRVGAIFQFDIRGDDGGVFYLDLLNGSGAIGSGSSPTGECDAALTMSMDDLQAMLQGQLQPFHAYMSGRLKVTGETRTAMKLEELVDDMKTCPSSIVQIV